MGGRGIRLSATRTMRDVVGQRAGGGGGEANPQGQAGGGGGAPEFTSANGTRVSAGGATDAQIRAALGDRFNREVVANIIGGGRGGNAIITVTGNTVNLQYRGKFDTSFSLTRSGGEVTFIGGSLFPGAGQNPRSVQGAGIRNLIRNIRYAVNGDYVQRLVVPSAIGSAGDQNRLGSSLWARMGANASLTSSERARLSNDTSLPSSVRNATTVSALMKSREGQNWWENNRRTFRGEIDFRVRQGDSYDIWSGFLG